MEAANPETITSFLPFEKEWGCVVDTGAVGVGDNQSQSLCDQLAVKFGERRPWRKKGSLGFLS